MTDNELDGIFEMPVMTKDEAKEHFRKLFGFEFDYNSIPKTMFHFEAGKVCGCAYNDEMESERIEAEAKEAAKREEEAKRLKAEEDRRQAERIAKEAAEAKEADLVNRDGHYRAFKDSFDYTGDSRLKNRASKIRTLEPVESYNLTWAINELFGGNTHNPERISEQARMRGQIIELNGKWQGVDYREEERAA